MARCRLTACAALCALVLAILLDGPIARADEHLSVQLPFQPAGSDAAVFLIAENGWAKKAGLDLDLLDGRGSASAIALVAAGQSDVGQGELGPAAVAIDKGAPIKAIAGWAQRPAISVFVDKDGPIKTPQDLRGKSITLIATSPWVPVLDTFLKHAGLQRSDVTLMFVDPSAMFATYSSRRADTMMAIGPYELPIVDPKRPSRTMDAADYGLITPGSGMFARESTIAAKHDALVKLIKLEIDAWNYIYAGHQDEAVQAIIKQRPNGKFNPSVLRGQIDAYHAYFTTPNTVGRPYGWQSSIDWGNAIASLQEAGVLKPGHKPSDFFTNELVEAAQP